MSGGVKCMACFPANAPGAEVVVRDRRSSRAYRRLMTLIEDRFTDGGVDHAGSQPPLDVPRCCAEALDEVHAAFWSFSSGAGMNEAAVARHLRHDHVTHELVDELGSDDAAGLVAFAEAVAGAVRNADAGGAWLLAGLAHLGAGDALAAEACLERAMRCEPTLGPAAGELAVLTLDRGDLARTARLLTRACCSRVVPELVRRHQHAQSAGAVTAGRNDPCPCGSGRKFKRCCDGRITASLAVRASLMIDRLAMYATHPDRRPILLLLAEVSLCDDDIGFDELEDRADDPFLLDLANFEGGLALDYLAERGELLADDERDLLERAVEEPLQLWKITAVDEGASMDLQDAATGRTVTIQERSGSRGRKPGEHLLARVVRGGDTWMMLGTPLLLDAARRRGVRALLAEEPGVLEWVAWYGALLAPPQLCNREGEPLVVCRAELAVGRPEGVVPVLDELLEAAGDGVTWYDEVELAPGDIVLRGSVCLDGELVVVQTNSETRHQRLLDALTAALDAEVLSEERRDAVDVYREYRSAHARPDEEEVSWPAGDPDMSPEAAAALEQYMIGYERAWVDRSLPALGGLTPRQAVHDPRHRPDLDDLLEEIADRAAPGLMSPPRIRELLGLAP